MLCSMAYMDLPVMAYSVIDPVLSTSDILYSLNLIILHALLTCTSVM